MTWRSSLQRSERPLREPRYLSRVSAAYRRRDIGACAAATERPARPGVTSRGPRSVAEERQRDVDIALQRLLDGRPRFFAAYQRLPRVQVLWFVKVAAGDVREVLEAGHGKQIVAVGRLPYIHQIR